jgi:hypothetical protein
MFRRLVTTLQLKVDFKARAFRKKSANVQMYDQKVLI